MALAPSESSSDSPHRKPSSDDSMNTLSYIKEALASTNYVALGHYSEFIASNIEEFTLVVVGSVLAGLILYPLLRNLEKPKFYFETFSTGDKLGFKVSVERRDVIKDARVICNNVMYPWIEEDKEIPRRDLFTGDITPCVFFPYQVSWDYVDEISLPTRNDRIIIKRPSDVQILLTIKEIPSQKIVFKEFVLIR